MAAWLLNITRVHYGDRTTTVTFTDSLSVNEQPSSPRELTVSVSTSIGFLPQSINDWSLNKFITRFPISQFAYKNIGQESLTTILNIANNACRGDTVETQFQFAQSIIPVKAYLVKQNISFVENIVVNFNLNFTLNTSLNFFNRPGWMLPPLKSNMSMIMRGTPQAYVQVYKTDVGAAITLYGPEFQNDEVFEALRAVNENRNGGILIYRKSTWPTNRVRRYSFSGIKKSVMTAFRTFVKNNAGAQIRIKDHEGNTWKGFITTPDIVFADFSKDSCGSYSFSFSALLEPV